MNREHVPYYWQAATQLGAKTQLPALWLYAEDDAIFAPSISKPFFDAYQRALPYFIPRDDLDQNSFYPIPHDSPE